MSEVPLYAARSNPNVESSIWVSGSLDSLVKSLNREDPIEGGSSAHSPVTPDAWGAGALAAHDREAHQKVPPPLGPPYGPRHGSTVGS